MAGERITLEKAKARAAVVALTEMRGWVLATEDRDDQRFLLPRIDTCLDAFGVLNDVRRISGSVLENFEG